MIKSSVKDFIFIKIIIIVSFKILKFPRFFPSSKQAKNVGISKFHWKTRKPRKRVIYMRQEFYFFARFSSHPEMGVKKSAKSEANPSCLLDLLEAVPGDRQRQDPLGVHLG